MKISITIYLLALEGGKYYVGQTDNVDFRYLDHLTGNGSKWTRMNKTIRIAHTKKIEVEDGREAVLYENWITLLCMERFGWTNVRGGDYLIVEEYMLKEKIDYIFDTETNKIRYYSKSRYLFGASRKWILYILKLQNGKFYIGSTKRLGKSLSKHFNGTGSKWTHNNKPIRVKELLILDNEDYLTVKREKREDYIRQYGWENVIGGNEQSHLSYGSENL